MIKVGDLVKNKKGIVYRVLRLLALSNHAEVVQVKTHATPTFVCLDDLEPFK